MLPTAFDLGSRTGLDTIVESDLKERLTVVNGNVLRATFVPGTDDSDPSLIFGPRSIAERMKMSGLCLQPCNPEVSLDAEGRASWTIPVLALDVMLDNTWREALTSKLDRSRFSVLSEASVYRDSGGTALLIADGTEAADLLKAVRPAKQVAQASAVACELCKHPVECSMMRHHMGAHLSQPSWAQFGKTRPSMPCGLCGVRDSIGQHLIDPSSLPGCPVSIKKGKAFHQCKLMGEVEYSLLTASKCSVSTPCTNRPFQCPKCPLVVWSYSLHQHFHDAHPTATIPEFAVAATSLVVHEAELVSQLLTAKAAKKICKDCPHGRV